MHVSSVAPGPNTTTATTPPTASTGRAAAALDDRNPWGFPRLDSRVARHAVDGLEAGARIADHLIDRSIAVRGLLDRNLKAGRFSSDTVKAVELLTRARDHALGTLQDRHLSSQLTAQVFSWMSASKDSRLEVVADSVFALRHAVEDLLDDDEGNVRDEITAMREHPSRRTFQTVRDSLDSSIEALYGSRDVSRSTQVLRAAGNLR